MAGGQKMKNPESMIDRVNNYILWKRGLGYSQKTEAGELLRFAKFAESINQKGPITTDLALKWTQLAGHNSRLYQAKRLELIRCFAKYEAIAEPLTEIPPKGIFGHAHIRIRPYIYTQKDIIRLMERAGELSPIDGLRPQTVQAFIGLLASTGLRVCEALKLDRADVDYDNKILFIRDTKFHKSRIIPAHESTIHALQEYSIFRNRYHPIPQSSRFFLSEKGKELPYSTICWNFQQIRNCLLTGETWNRRSPRLHDLRHTFACNRLLKWYQEGIDINQTISSLSTYLGHVKLSDTYWYLTGTPELFSIAAEKFEKYTYINKEDLL